MSRRHTQVVHAALASLLALAVPATAQEAAPADAPAPKAALGPGIVGEPGPTGALLQCRLHVAHDPTRALDGTLRFFVWPAEQEGEPELVEGWRREVAVTAAGDGIGRVRVTGLAPDTRHNWLVVATAAGTEGSIERRGTWRTLPAPDTARRLRLAVVTGMNRHRFLVGDARRPAYAGDDRDLGYPALAAIAAREPDLVVFTGDNVYYDQPRETSAKTRAEMRRHWAEQFAFPRFATLFGQTATAWLKDDHDFRFNDADRTGKREPSTELGIEVFREQVPVVDAGDAEAPTYRRIRAGADVEMWFVEGRDFRHANRAQDGPTKSLWGPAQRAWLQRTLAASDATFKLLVSPTPMVGPDDGYKRDNHANLQGFRHEGDAFFAWAAEQGLPARGLVVVCGDRHWQYAARHPTGVVELSCGALCDANSRIGRRPGDPRSTDPEGEIEQLWTQTQRSGGFLELTIDRDDDGARCEVRFLDERGEELHARTLRPGG